MKPDYRARQGGFLRLQFKPEHRKSGPTWQEDSARQPLDVKTACHAVFNWPKVVNIASLILTQDQRLDMQWGMLHYAWCTRTQTEGHWRSCQIGKVTGTSCYELKSVKLWILGLVGLLQKQVLLWGLGLLSERLPCPADVHDTKVEMPFCCMASRQHAWQSAKNVFHISACEEQLRKIW